VKPIFPAALGVIGRPPQIGNHRSRDKRSGGARTFQKTSINAPKLTR
jgi:hypothetical protein